MLPLLQLKEKAVGNLKNYAISLKNRLMYIKLAIDQVKCLKKSTNSTSIFDKFKLTRLLHFDLKKWVEILKENPAIKEIAISQSLRPKMASKIDYYEGLYAINRLQSTYRLEHTEMANGLLGERQYRTKPWSSLECLMVGYVFYLDEKFQGAERWFQLALERYFKNPKLFEIFGWNRDLILKLLMKASQSSGRYKAALGYAERAKSNCYWQEQITRLKNLSMQPEVLKPAEPKNKYKYKPACRMQYPDKHNLHCRYLKSSPFLKLAPIQVEELNLEPPINMYHNLINEKEISVLKNLSSAHLKRSQFVTEDNTLVKDFSNLRTCKTMRLQENVNEKLLKNLNQRITDATGLSVLESEELQLTNYGIGGHLYEHQDASFNLSSEFWNSGNRVITALFYLSDVAQGGETLFPHLDLRVHTQKGSLLVWDNLLLNGSIDWRVEHISCPILMGDKWLATKWLREKPQMFIRRCPLKLKPVPEFHKEAFEQKFFGENDQPQQFSL
nr:prolyl 4-hydroxylase subunit alpha-2-like [Drosophila kikkawai]